MPALAPPLAPGCPWSGFTPPNLDWCERELCAWIVNPADTWSNVAYLVGALVMWRLARGRADLAHFAPASALVGVFSFAYHMSYTWMLQFFDFVGMFVFCFLVLARNAVRLGHVAPGRERAVWLGGTALASACVPPLFWSGAPIQATVFVLIVASIAQEAVLWRRGPRAGYAAYAAAIALLAAAAAFSAADLSRAWCDPDDHWIQGHAIWHVLSAASLVALLVFYARRPAPGPASSASR
ncbi:MAG: ceramidase domain-containing protein [Myxococcota bacterium]|nr:ceramidase domain-containing protein [Myxococcales bacterium]